MLYRAIKYQVDKGPVDSVTGKAKRTLNDSHLLREDIDYGAMVAAATRPGCGQRRRPLTLNCLSAPDANSSGGAQRSRGPALPGEGPGHRHHHTGGCLSGWVSPVRPPGAHLSAWVPQVKDKILDQVYRGAPFSQRPAADSLDLGNRAHSRSRARRSGWTGPTDPRCPVSLTEWRSGQAGHLTLSDEDVTAVVHGRWKRLNTLQHYKVERGRRVLPRPPRNLSYPVVTLFTPTRCSTGSRWSNGGADSSLSEFRRSRSQPGLPDWRE